MYNLIAASFFQNKQCQLPGIGSLWLVTTPAQTDFVNTLIKAPVQKIVFNAQTDAKNIFNEFSAIAELLKKKLEEGEQVNIKGLGVLYKNEAGDFDFAGVQLPDFFMPSVTALRVIRQHAQHAILVGDKETNNAAMTEYFNDTAETKDKWWIWALIIAAAAICLLAIYIFMYGFNGLSSAMHF